MMTRTTNALLALNLLAVAIGAAPAQDFSVDWYTIDGGGGDCAGNALELSATIGQPDAGFMSGGGFELTGGFWPGATEAGGGCAGSERVSKATCKDRNGSNQLKVILVGGVEGDVFTVTLTDGSTKSGTINTRGKGKAKFNNRPPGDAATATAEWGCGASDQKDYACP